MWKILLLDGLAVIENISLCYVLLKKQWHRGEKKVLFWLLVTFSLYIVALIYGKKQFVVNLFFAVALILINRYLFEDTLLKAVKTCGITWLLSAFLEFTVGITIRKSGETLELIFITVIVLVITWLYHFLIGRKLDYEMFHLPIKLWGMIGAILLLMNLMLSYFYYLMMSVVREEMIITGNILIMFGGIAICGLIIAFTYYFSKMAAYRMQKEVAEKYNEQQREYFQDMLEKEQDTRQFRHDIIGHLVAMEELCEQNEYEDLRKYLKELLEDVQCISKSQYNVGNDIVNVILNYYFQPIKDSCNIKVNGFMKEEQPMLQKDMCILISNLAKNAVEAVSTLPEEEREIKVLVSQGKSYLRICIENTYSGNLKLDTNGNVVTMKKDTKNHGYGMKNITEIVEKYHGKKEIKMEQNRFVVDIILGE